MLVNHTHEPADDDPVTRQGWIDHMVQTHGISPTHFRDRGEAEVGEIHLREHLRHQTASAVDHPAYYGGANNPHEVIKCLAAHGLLDNAPLFNVVKYILRAGKKHSNVVEDLKKARWYLDYEITRQDLAGSERAHDIGG